MTDVLIDVIFIGNIFSISRLMNWVISDPLVTKRFEESKIFSGRSHACRLDIVYSFVKK